MSVKSDSWIIEQSEKNSLIAPFAKDQVKKLTANGTEKGIISFGTSSYGYDMRLGHDFKLLKTLTNQAEIDPKNLDLNLFEPFQTKESFLLRPHGLVLAQTIEYFKIPRDILTICFGKSTYARCGVFVNVTPFEPEWEGFPTISISNLTSVPVRLHPGEGIAQILFLEASEVCAVSYQDRKGKYQSQKEITTARI